MLDKLPVHLSALLHREHKTLRHLCGPARNWNFRDRYLCRHLPLQAMTKFPLQLPFKSRILLILADTGKPSCAALGLCAIP